MKHEEEILQKVVVAYIRANIKPDFPSLVLIANPLSSMSFSRNQKQNQRIMQKANDRGLERGQPDIIISFKKGEKCGLALELKIDRNKVFSVKTGKLLKNEHLERQKDVLENLSENGFVSRFACSKEEALAYVRSYFEISQLSIEELDVAFRQKQIKKELKKKEIIITQSALIM